MKEKVEAALDDFAVTLEFSVKEINLNPFTQLYLISKYTPPLMYKTQNLHKSDLYEQGIKEL